MKMHAQLYFHPIGQGCFYSGLIDLDNNNVQFSFVYDCGTVSAMHYLENEIDRFKTNEIGDVLDLLVISHFDADHVNGVVRLLESIRCRRLVIPYYAPIERLLLYTVTHSNDDDYRRMLQNPIGYFGNGEKFKIDEIIVVGGPEGDGGTSQENALPSPGSDSDEISTEELPSESVDFNDRPAEESKDLRDEISAQEPTVSNIPNVKFFRTPYSFRIGVKIWEFAFYFNEINNHVLLRDFTNDVNTILEKEKIDILRLFEKDYIDELIYIYNKYSKNKLNVTSLATYHGPLIKCKRIYCCCEWPWCHYYHHHSMANKHDRRPGTLLTGDIDISTVAKLNPLESYFRAYLDRICVFQVPHHGSKANWPILQQGHSFHKFCHYVINHGLGRKSHPGSKVIADLIEKCGRDRIHLNNEATPFYYRLLF